MIIGFLEDVFVSDIGLYVFTVERLRQSGCLRFGWPWVVFVDLCFCCSQVGGRRNDDQFTNGFEVDVVGSDGR
ncbi:hypothetical protein EV182_003749, partial [Spiromyces aspiralis]